MTGGLGIWVVGACGSALANLALVSVLSVALRPEPVVQQKSPQSELDVQAYRLNRDRAAEQTPEPGIAAPSEPDRPRMDPGRIPQSQAVARLPDTTPTSAQPPPQDRLDAKLPVLTRQEPAKARPASLNAAQAPGMDLPDLTPAALPIAAARAPVSNSMKSKTTNDLRLPQITTSPLALDTAERVAVALPQAAGNADTLPPSPAPLQKTSPAPMEPDKMTAALAFSGGANGEIDPASLAAFQSFVRPEDAPTQGASVRDTVANLLAQVPCSRLQVEFDPETTTLRVKGHIPENGLRAPVLSALQAQMGANIILSDDILILPRPQCGALSGISDVGLPQSTDQITNPLLIGDDTQVRELDFVKGDRLYFDLTAPDYDAYIYVDYFDADGNVLHLSPNGEIAPERIAAGSLFRVGASGLDEDGLQIFIGPPYGQEISAAFAASVPLYDEARPLVEPAAAYLDWIAEKVAIARATNPDFKGEWVYFFVTTSAN